MRSYYSELVKNQFLRINYIMEDPEIGSPKHGSDPTPKHKGMRQVFEILKWLKKTLNLSMNIDRACPGQVILRAFKSRWENYLLLSKV